MPRLMLLLALIMSLLQPISLAAMDEDTPIYVHTKVPVVNSPLLWLGGAVAVVGAGVGGYALGKNLGDRENEGPPGETGPCGAHGLKGGPGGVGEYGIAGPIGTKGSRGATGYAGDKGPCGTLEQGPDPLCFYFFHDESSDDESFVGLVTTPEGDQFTTNPIVLRTGAFTDINPLPSAPLGVYHVTIVPSQGGKRLRAHVIVLRNGATDVILPYSYDTYQANMQMTVNYIYHKTN